MNATLTKLVVGAVSAALGAVHFPPPANAADLPVKAPAYNYTPAPDYWAGSFWVGANVGWGGFNGNDTYTGTDPLSQFILNAANKIGVPTAYSESTSGIIGGFQLGYDYRLGESGFLVGLFGQWDYWGQSQTSAANGSLGRGLVWNTQSGLSLTDQGDLDASASITFGQWKVTAFGGLSVGQVGWSAKGGLNIPGTGFSTQGQQTLFGWNVGGKLCYALSNHWNTCATYEYADLGSFNASFVPVTGINVLGNHDITDQSGKLEINYKF